MSRIGLYYPFIHFRDPGWLKLAALYWTRMARIVPQGYELEDSPTVRQLQDELDFVRNLDPTAAATQVAPLFTELLNEHGPALRKRYAPQQGSASQPVVQMTDARSRRLQALAGQPPWPAIHVGFHIALPPPVWSRVAMFAADLAHIAAGKMEPRLTDAMLQSGLVVRSRQPWRGTSWLSMHPQLAMVYLTALAEEMAAASMLEPLTDRALDHVAVSGWTMPRLAQALLDDTPLVGSAPSSLEVQDQLGMLAVESVVPRDLANLSVEKVIEIRTRFADEFASFRAHLELPEHGLR